MQNLRTYFFTGLMMVSIFGCKKVIDVKLKNATTQIVITGEVNNKRGPYKVSISESVDFASDNNYPGVSGAFVTISGNGITDTLSENEPGNYYTHRLEGKPGKSYSLLVSLNGKQYTATSVMPQPVHLDSITFLIGTNNNIYAVANFQDPPNVPNYYQFTELSDGQKLSNGRGNSVFSDRLSDGRYIRAVLYDDSSDIKSGTTLTVQMNCVDKAVYNYLNELLQVSTNASGFTSPSPANPTSNITGGALGYFSANTVTAKSVEIH
jgi:hypothetical protein